MISPIRPSGNGGRRRRRPGRLSKRDRVWLLCAGFILVVLVMANGFWSDAMFPLPIAFVMLVVMAFTELPHVAFGAVAAFIVVLGCYLRWPPKLARQWPPVRGLALLVVIVVLHAAWFHSGWMPFRPPCSGSSDPFYGRETLLKGPLKAEAARRFVDVLKRQYSKDAVRLLGDHTVLVRPAIALFPNSVHERYTINIADDLGGRVSTGHCGAIEEALMARGHADSRLVGYGYWPWNTFDEDGAVVQWLLGLHKD